MRVLRAAGFVATAAVAVLALALAVAGFGPPAPTLRIAGAVPALDLLFGVAPLGAAFCALTGVLTGAAALWGIRRERAVDGPLIAGFAAAMLAVLCARSVAAFFLAWEAMAILSLFLVAAHHERPGVRRAAVTYILVSQGGALCLLVALTALVAFAGDPAFPAIAAAAPRLPPGLRAGILALAALAFGSKAGLVPLHFWLPRAHPVAPPHASALLSGAMLNVALYGLILVFFGLAAPAPPAWGIVLIAAGALSAVGGVLYATVETNLKRLLAHSSTEHLGIATIAIGLAVLAEPAAPALAAVALAAGLFHAVNHGLFKGLLFLAAGAVADAEGTVDLDRLGGAWRTLRFTAPAFVVGAAAAVGIPLTNGFASELIALQTAAVAVVLPGAAAKAAAVAALAALALSGGLAVAAFAKATGIAFFGRRRRPLAVEPAAEAFDPGTAALAGLAIACVAIGVAPGIVFNPLAAIAAALTAAPAAPAFALPLLPLTLAALPLAGALAALLLAARRGVRAVPTWTCGSPAGVRSQYTATAFAKPLATVFAFLLLPRRQRRVSGGASHWFPERIAYRTSSRYVVDDATRLIGALVLRVARRSRALQSGSLRLYLAYAVAAAIVVAVAAR